MKDLTDFREALNAIDSRMAALFEERMGVCAQIAAWKGERGLPVRDPAREEEVIKRGLDRIGDPAIREYYVRFQRAVMAAACAYEERLLADAAEEDAE